VIAHHVGTQQVGIIAYLVPEQGQTLDIGQLRAALAEQLPNHMVPRAFAVLDQLPLTNNGKLDRRALPIPDAMRDQTAGGVIAPNNQLEQQLVDIWRDILQIDNVGVSDNFFDLGGHSLLIMSLRDRLATVFQQSVSPVDIFKYPTIRTLVEAFGKTTSGEAVSPKPRSRRNAERISRRKAALSQ